MFKRFTDSAKRVIFFALYYARLDEAPVIDSVHLLRGLMFEDTRANMLFHLRERFPMYGGCPKKFATYEAVPKPELGLDHGAKRILARAAWEADNLAITGSMLNICSWQSLRWETQWPRNTSQKPG